MNPPRIDVPRVAAPRAGAVGMATLAFFFLMDAYYVIRPVRDQLGGAGGSASLPLIYLTVFVVMLAMTPAFGWLVARFPRRRLVSISYGVFALCLLAFVPAFEAQDRIGVRALGVVFYVWVSIFNLFAVSLFWSVMADLFNALQARRVFATIALGGMAGALFGPTLTRYLVRIIGVAPLLLVALVALLACLGLLLWLLRERIDPAARQRDQGVGGSLWGGLAQLWQRPFLRYMAVLLLFGDGIGTLAYALVADYAKAHLHDAVARTAFYNDLDLVTNLIGAALQLSLTPWLMVRRGAGAALVLAALINLVLLAAIATIGARPVALPWIGAVSSLTVLIVVSRAFAYGMTKPAVDALYTRVPRETRYKGKNFVETAVWRFGDFAVTGLVSLAGSVGIGVAGMALGGAGVAAAASWVSSRVAHSPDLAPESAAETADAAG